MQDHERIMEALRQRDGAALAQALGDHLRQTWDRISPVFKVA